MFDNISKDTKADVCVQIDVSNSAQDFQADVEHHGAVHPEHELVDIDTQRGIQEVEAVTLSWTKTSMIVAYVLIWLIYFVQGLVGGINGALLPYVTSNFAMHSLTATTGVVSSVVGGVTNLSIAKVLDIFGRPQGFLFCSALATIGLIMSAACNDVEAYAASQVFYTIGINGIGYSLSVFIADTTSLRHRGLVQSLCATPGLITAWLGGPISTSLLSGAGWRWAFGMESILVPAVTLPLSGLFVYHYWRAKKQGMLPRQGSGHTPLESLLYYLREFDVLGLLLLSVGTAFVLLPFNLYALQAKGWASALVVSFLISGIALLIAFTIWEKAFSPVSLIPWTLMKDSTVVGACLLSLALFLTNSCWALYLSSILQVVNGLSVTHASYVAQTQSFAGPFFAVLIGAFISHTKRFKPVTVYLGLPILTLGTGLMIYFHNPNAGVGYIVMSIIFITFGGSVIAVTDEIAVLAAVGKQQFFAVAIALVSMMGSIGQAIGLTISSAIWQGVVPKSLAKYLPPEDLPSLALIYADLETQLSYPVGSPTRTAIQQAYGDAQEFLFVAATASMALAFVGTLMWRNIDVTSMKQTKGRVF